jgi:transcriptional regulator with XRE-family HTH domain
MRLRQLRHDKGYSLERTAAAAGVHTSTVWRWEMGELSPSLLELEPVAEAWSMTPTELVSRLYNTVMKGTGP